MRTIAKAFTVALLPALAALSTARVCAQSTAPEPGSAPITTSATGSAPAAAAAPGAEAPACTTPGALGTSRVIEIDTAGGPGFGAQYDRTHDLLAAGEVVLTFDDGPLPHNTLPVLQALQQECARATFFMVGRMALAAPELVRRVAAEGHTVGTHTYSHMDLGGHRRAGRSMGDSVPQSGSFWSFGGGDAPVRRRAPVFLPAPTQARAEAEIERGITAVSQALGQPVAPFFRFPYLDDTQALKRYLGTRNVAMFSIDVDTFDYRTKNPEDVIRRAMNGLRRERRGIILFHDIQGSTAAALPALLARLKAENYRIVHLVPKAPVVLASAGELPMGAAAAAVAEPEPVPAGERKRKRQARREGIETAEAPAVKSRPRPPRPPRQAPPPSAGWWFW